MTHVVWSDRPSWHASALCAQSGDPDIWFPGPKDQVTAALARRICSMCPFTAPCLLDGLAAGDVRGIRAGMSARERRKVAHDLKREAAA